jgi:hypothetical protein
LTIKSSISSITNKRKANLLLSKPSFYAKN